MTLPCPGRRWRRWRPRPPRPGHAAHRRSGLGEVVGRMAISASSFAARSSRPPWRKASTLSRRVFTSRTTMPRILVLGQRDLLRLLGVVDGVLHHPQHVAAQRVTRPHGCGRIVMESFAKGHRMAPRASRLRRSSPCPRAAPMVGFRDGDPGRRYRLGRGCRGAVALTGRGTRWLSRCSRARSSCASLPSASASQTASRNARVGEPRRGCHSAGSSC